LRFSNKRVKTFTNECLKKLNEKKYEHQTEMSEVGNYTLNYSNLSNNLTQTKEIEIDYTWFYFLSIKTLGLLTNSINIIIFFNKKFKDKAFTYLLYHSISEFFYLLFVSLSVIPICDSFCEDSFLSKFILVYTDSYFTSCLAIFAISIEITISLQRYLIVSNKRFCGIIKNGPPHKISCFLFILSLLYYSPVLIFCRIKHSTISPGKYQVVEISNVNSYFSFFALIFRGLICTLLLTFINFKTLIRFRKRMKIKAIINNSFLS
jgi:hypothetical protein